MRKILGWICMLFCLAAASIAAAENVPDLTGAWRFIGGGELLGYGFELRENGTGRYLESDDWAVFPQRHLRDADSAPFQWRVFRQEDVLCLELTLADGQAALYQIVLEEGGLSVRHADPEAEGGGGYERYDEGALRAWLEMAEQTALTSALRDYLDDVIETSLPGLGLRSPEIWVYPSGNGYALRISAVVNDIVWTVEAEMDAGGTRVTWNPLNPSSAAPDAEGGQAAWDAEVPLYGVLQSAVASAEQAVAEANAEERSVTELHGTVERWRPGRTYPVYQGPGKSYGRSGGGKAKVSTNDSLTVYGLWKGWLLISYDISPGHSRFGWLQEADVGPDAFAGYETLPFSLDSDGMDSFLGVLTQVYELTDDPDKSKASSGRLAAGSSVHCLATYADQWMLVEGFSKGKLVMGFVPAEIVDREHGYTDSVQYVIDQAKTYTEQEIRAAMDLVRDEIHASWAGANLLRLKYLEKESNEEAAWYTE